MKRQLSASEKLEVLKRDGYRCRYCGKRGDDFHFDHVFPYSRGGETTVANIVLACPSCNQSKHAKIGIFPKPIGYYSKSETLFEKILKLIDATIDEKKHKKKHNRSIKAERKQEKKHDKQNRKASKRGLRREWVVNKNTGELRGVQFRKRSIGRESVLYIGKGRNPSERHPDFDKYESIYNKEVEQK